MADKINYIVAGFVWCPWCHKHVLIAEGLIQPDGIYVSNYPRHLIKMSVVDWMTRAHKSCQNTCTRIILYVTSLSLRLKDGVKLEESRRALHRTHPVERHSWEKNTEKNKCSKLYYVGFMVLNANFEYFCYIVAVLFIGGRNQRKPRSTCRKSLTNFITNLLSRSYGNEMNLDSQWRWY